MSKRKAEEPLEDPTEKPHTKKLWVVRAEWVGIMYAASKEEARDLIQDMVVEDPMEVSWVDLLEPEAVLPLGWDNQCIPWSPTTYPAQYIPTVGMIRKEAEVDKKVVVK